jgi:hypothetical protein
MTLLLLSSMSSCQLFVPSVSNPLKLLPYLNVLTSDVLQVTVLASLYSMHSLWVDSPTFITEYHKQGHLVVSHDGLTCFTSTFSPQTKCTQQLSECIRRRPRPWRGASSMEVSSCLWHVPPLQEFLTRKKSKLTHPAAQAEKPASSWLPPSSHCLPS